MRIAIRTRWGLLLLLVCFLGVSFAGTGNELDRELAQVLRDAGFTGTIDSQLEQRLGGRLSKDKADLGRFLFFDPLLGIQLDNSCAGCHSPTTRVRRHAVHCHRH